MNHQTEPRPRRGRRAILPVLLVLAFAITGGAIPGAASANGSTIQAQQASCSISAWATASTQGDKDYCSAPD